jgi:hypothetical protein
LAVASVAERNFHIGEVIAHGNAVSRTSKTDLA